MAGGGSDGLAPASTVELSPSPLSVERAALAVAARGAGGTCLFIGTTRDVFEGLPVLRLEYECYEELAIAQLQAIAATQLAVVGSVSSPVDRLVRVYIGHRLGVVPVGEASVIVAASSVHRGRAFDAVPAIMHALKATAAIWKREVYGDGAGAADGATWKVNRECVEARGIGGGASACAAATAAAPLITAPVVAAAAAGEAGQ